jgi:hypothetical protein
MRYLAVNLSLLQSAPSDSVCIFRRVVLSEDRFNAMCNSSNTFCFIICALCGDPRPMPDHGLAYDSRGELAKNIMGDD